MGGLLHFLDFNHTSSSRKSLRHKRHADGLEAPRNSFDISPETSHNHQSYREHVSLSCQVKNPAKASSSHRIPVKRLIDEEMCEAASSSRNAPSVIARLMGMDTLPSEKKSSTTVKERSKEVPNRNLLETHSAQNVTFTSVPLKQRREEQILKTSQQSRTRRPKPREHPQEEILQKFKREFEAWQSNKEWETSKASGFNNTLPVRREEQVSAQRNINREMNFHNSHSKQSLALQSSFEHTGNVPRSATNVTRQEVSSRREGSLTKQCQSHSLEAGPLVNKIKSCDSSHLMSLKPDEKHCTSSSPSRIVILKAGSDITDGDKETWCGPLVNMQKEPSMEDFLGEVRERLRMEIYGNPRIAGASRESATEALSRQRPCDPKQIAQQIARQVRESVTRDMEAALIRSKSIRSCKSEFQSDGLDSPELRKRDMKRLLPNRIRNNLENEAEYESSSITHEKERASVYFQDEIRFRSCTDVPDIENNSSYWGDSKIVSEGKTISFREKEENGMALHDDMPPKNLRRSLSAPVGGTAFGKLLLEDQHVLTGAYIRQKHGTIDNTSFNKRKNRKDSFNFRDKVSNLRSTFTKGKFFSKRIPHVEEEGSNVYDCACAKVVSTVPSVVVNPGIAQENHTEVPPSPASVSSGSHDDLCKPGHPSPVSPLELPFIEEHPSLEIPDEINPKLSELSPSLTHETDGPEELVTEINLYDDEVIDIDDLEEAYVRDVLVAAGFYDQELACNTLLRWEALSRPLARWVYEEVEDVYSNKCEKTVDESGSPKSFQEESFDYKLLFDLLNEALPVVLQPPFGSTGLKSLTRTANLPHGKKLLKDAWNQIECLTNLPSDSSVESMAAYDLRKAPWPVLVYEEADGVGMLVGVMILEQLLDDFVHEICSW